MKSVFLTAEGFGITSTSANYLANLAQEVQLEKKTTLEKISFLSSKIVTPLCPDGLEYGRPNFDLENISATIREIGMMNAFCAWMREAIKAKENALLELGKITFEKWAKDKDIKIPEAPELKVKTKEDVTNELAIGERLRMLRAEAIAAAYGKLIHPYCPVSDARKELLDRKVNPVEKTGTGQDLTLTVYTPAVEVADVDKMFVALQNEQREAEKELNSFKAMVSKSTSEQKADAERKHASAIKEHQAAMNALQAEYNAFITEEREKINQLKVVVPEALMETYKYLNGLGK